MPRTETKLPSAIQVVMAIAASFSLTACPCENVPNASAVKNGNQCIAVCNSGYADCNANLDSKDGCESSLTSATTCGACDNNCLAESRNTATATCVSGTCRIDSCKAGYRDCNGNHADGCEVAVNTTSNCGACGNDCLAAERHTTSGMCDNGNCRIVQCEFLYDDCNNNDADGCETSLDTNANCGACGVTCTGSCSGGACFP